MNTKAILRPWLALSLLFGGVVHAQTNWNAQTGSFTNPANWNNGLPTSATDTLITNGTAVLPSVVTLGPAQNGSVKNLTLNSFGTLNVSLGSSLNLFGANLADSGALNIFAGSGTNSILGLNASTTLSGGGTITLNSGDNNGQAFIQQQVGGANLTNTDNTIQGYGVIGNSGLKVINGAAGTILANSAGNTLTLNGNAGVTNAGLLAAANGGTLNLAVAVTDNTGGTIHAGTGSAVNIGGGSSLTTIQNGTLSTIGTGVIQNVGNAWLRFITLSSGSTFQGNAASFTLMDGTLANHGNFQINNATLATNASTTFTGGGTVTLNNSTIKDFFVGSILTNVDNTIQGYGDIGNGTGLVVFNATAGTIIANSAGNTLTLDGTGGVTNNGLLAAANGGTLNLGNNNLNIDNTGGTIRAGAGSTVLLGNPSLTTITSGTLATTGTGIIENAGNVWLRGVALSAGSTFQGDSGSLTLVESTMANHGNYQINNASLATNFNTTFTGGGTVTLNNSVIRDFIFGSTLTNTDNTIQGYGVIGNSGLKVINGAAGTILANSAGNTLLFNGSYGLTNNGTMQVDGGSTLKVVGDLPNNGKIVLGASFASAGDLIEIGNYTQGSSATLLDMISSPFLNGKFDVTGNIYLSGILDIELIDGFMPIYGELFTLINFSGTEYGTFSSIIGSDMGNWNVLYNPGNNGQVDLEFIGRPTNATVPEAGSCAWLLAVVMLAMIFVSRQPTQRNEYVLAKGRAGSQQQGVSPNPTNTHSLSF